ncbi:WGR domain-containing protein [Microvirga arabica]|uniref:WGR domain-containing protein n=1 Tax=Microvirga arabica TaxID=1128671 RepID=UPI003618F0BE
MSATLDHTWQQNPVSGARPPWSRANIARFYVLAIEANLSGDATLIREWGRIGAAGQRNIESRENVEPP